MILSELQNIINGKCFINRINENNNIETEEQKVPFKLKDEKTSDIYNLESNQLITRRFAKNYIAKSLDDNYKVLIYDDIDNNYKGSLENLFLKIFNLKLKKNIDNILLDIFLIGGGSSGSCMKSISIGLPVTGEVIQKNKLKFNKNDEIKISIGRGGESIDSEWINHIEESEWYNVEDKKINKGEDTLFNDYIAKGGQKEIVIKDDGTSSIENFYGSYGKELNNSNPIYIRNVKNGDPFLLYYDPVYLGAPYFGTNENLLLQYSNLDNLSKKNLKIPYTNIEVCTNGISTIHGQQMLVDSWYNGLKSASLINIQSPLYEYFLKKDFPNFKIFSVSDWYIDSYLHGGTLSCSILEGKDNTSYGGSGDCGGCGPMPIIGYAANHHGVQCYQSFKESLVKKGISQFQYFDFYRGRIGAGGNGCCAIIVRSDYFES